MKNARVPEKKVIIAKRNRGEVVKNAGATAGCVISNRNWWTIFGRSAIIAAKKGVMYMKIAEQIVSQRTRLGMTQEELADRLEISRQSVSKWETGASVPEIDKLVKMARLFGVSLDELVTGEAPMSTAPVEKGVSIRQILAGVLLVLAVLCLAVTVLLGHALGMHTSEGVLMALWLALLGVIAWEPGNQKLRVGITVGYGIIALMLLVLSFLQILWFQGLGIFVLIGLTLAGWAVHAGLSA